MSVRRLADDAQQPTEFAFSRENAVWADALLKKYPDGRQQSAVIPLLMRAQEQEGWVTKAAIEHVADRLEMPLIRVLEVATFYTQFQLKPVGTKAHIQICGTTPCMLRGSEGLIKLCKHKINMEPFTPNKDGTLSWEEVECQGACVNAPMVMIFKDAYEDLTPERLEQIIDAFEAGKGDTIPVGPQIDRHGAAPTGGLTSLTDESAIIAAMQARRDASGIKFANVDTQPDQTPKQTELKSEKVKSKPQSAPTSTESMKPDAASLTAEEADMAEKLAGLPKDATPLDKANAVGTKPEGLEKARDGIADDLKRIKGIGKVNEGKLNALGIWHFDQIAQWERPEVKWVGVYLSFPGRIDREEWISQAEVLAKGGDTEFSQRVDRGQVASSAGGTPKKAPKKKRST